jgi:tetratricopeptide (TPR) repeat protein
MKGQQALTRLRAAEAALARGDFAAAESEAEAARQLAAWDRGVTDFFARLTEAKLRAQRETDSRAQQARVAQINELLKQATAALGAKQYELAINYYDRVLAIDPDNSVALNGKGNAFTAKTVAEAAAGGGRTGGAVHTFVPGITKAESAEKGGAGGPEGFEPSAGVTVKQGTQAAELPGRIVFEPSPSAPKPGDRYRVAVYLQNEGSQPIRIASMTTAITVDGKRQSGPVAPGASTIAPKDRALIYQMPEQVWKVGTTSWSFEVVVSTTNRATYRNTLTWK